MIRRSEKRAAQAPAAPQRVTDRRLGEILADQGLVDRAALSALLAENSGGAMLGSLLIERGLVDERSIAWALAQQYGLTYTDLRDASPEREALAVVPEELVRRYRLLPLSRTNGSLLVAAPEPPQPAAVEEVAKAAGLEVRVALAASSQIIQAIESAYRALPDIERLLSVFESVDARRDASAEAAAAMADDAPIVQVVNMIITQALRDRASDVHIEPQSDGIRVRFRIDGAMQDALTLPASTGPAVVSRIKIMASLNIFERQRPQDGQLSTNVDGRPIDVRVSTVPTVFGEKTVLRLLDKTKTLIRLRDLGMPQDIFDAYAGLIRSPFGMVISAGPTGSGKTTTLYATLSEADTGARNVMTVEDPVEYILPSINQIQIREQSGVSFAMGLRSILRQDPDVILVGEIRDVETARIAIQSALTGHLVLSSLHATDATAALTRFLDMGIEPFLVASSVVGVLAQRLVRRMCRSCAVQYRPSPEEVVFYEEAGGAPKTTFWRGDGCNLCSQTGFRERIGVFELLDVTDEIRTLLVHGGSHSRLRELAAAQGMRTIRSNAVDLVASDVTTIGEVIRTVYVS